MLHYQPKGGAGGGKHIAFEVGLRNPDFVHKWCYMQCSFRCIRVLFTCWGAIFRHRDRREKRKVCAGAFSSKNRFICSMDTHRTVVFGIWGYIQVKMCLLHCLHAFHIFSRSFFVLPRRWRRQWTSDENIYPPTHNKTMFQFHSVGAVGIFSLCRMYNFVEACFPCS